MIDAHKIHRLFNDHQPQIIGIGGREYAVLLPLIEQKGELCLLLEKRANTISQPGEISFPGGRRDKSDPSLLDTALRETGEELGIEAQDIEIISPFNTIIPPYNKVIYSFLGKVREGISFTINSNEVEEVIFVPLRYLIETTPLRYRGEVGVKQSPAFPFDKIPGGRNYNFIKGSYDTYFYEYEDIVIWGLTAALIKSFSDVLRRGLSLEQ
ncbi:MAG: CoA pyrophosphatase, partial [Filifactor alocis]|nr:CoA pyrophosphatase [Filifactor alocis]